MWFANIFSEHVASIFILLIAEYVTEQKFIILWNPVINSSIMDISLGAKLFGSLDANTFLLEFFLKVL